MLWLILSVSVYLLIGVFVSASENRKSHRSAADSLWLVLFWPIHLIGCGLLWAVDAMELLLDKYEADDND